MLFDLRKYDAHIRRIDPAFREQDDVYFERATGERIKLEGFQKFAAKAYSILAEEENQSANYGTMDDIEDETEKLATKNKKTTGSATDDDPEGYEYLDDSLNLNVKSPK